MPTASRSSKQAGDGAIDRRRDGASQLTARRGAARPAHGSVDPRQRTRRRAAAPATESASGHRFPAPAAGAAGRAAAIGHRASNASAAASPARPPAPRSTTSCARADCAREADASQPTRRFPATRERSAASARTSASFFPSLRLWPWRNLVGQRAQLPLVEHRVVDHADQDLLHRAVAEPVDDALDGFGRDPPARLGRVIDIGAALDRVRACSPCLRAGAARCGRWIPSAGADNCSRTASAVTGAYAQTSCMTSRSRSPSSGRLPAMSCPCEVSCSATDCRANRRGMQLEMGRVDARAEHARPEAAGRWHMVFRRRDRIRASWFETALRASSP